MENQDKQSQRQVYRHLNGCPETFKRTAFFSLIRYFVVCGATVWDPCQQSNSETMEKVQCSAARLLLKNGYGRHSNVSDMLEEVGWISRSAFRRHVN